MGRGRGHATSMSSWQPLPWSDPALTSASALPPSQTLSGKYAPICLWLIAETMVTYSICGICGIICEPIQVVPPGTAHLWRNAWVAVCTPTV